MTLASLKNYLALQLRYRFASETGFHWLRPLSWCSPWVLVRIALLYLVLVLPVSLLMETGNGNRPPEQTEAFLVLSGIAWLVYLISSVAMYRESVTRYSVLRYWKLPAPERARIEQLFGVSATDLPDTLKKVAVREYERHQAKALEQQRLLDLNTPAAPRQSRPPPRL